MFLALGPAASRSDTLRMVPVAIRRQMMHCNDLFQHSADHGRRLKLLFCLICLVVLRAQRGWGQSTFTVTNNSDPGSFRTSVNSADEAAGSTVTWSGTGGTITLGSDLSAITANTTFDVSNATAAVTIAGFSIPLQSTVTFTNNSSQTWTISSVISSTGSLTFTGTGELVLSGANTYTGGTNLNAGILNVSTNSALGTGALTFNGGTLQAGAPSLILANNMTLNTVTNTFDTQSSTSTLTGVISDGSNSGTLTVIGNGTLVLTNTNNSYSGGTFLNGGTLNITSDLVLGNLASTTTFNGGALQAGANITSGRYIVLNGSGGTFYTNGLSSTLSGVISGPGALNIIGATADTDFLALTGNNTFTGPINVSSATLNISSDTALGSASGVLTLTDATLQSATGSNIADSRTIVLNDLGGTFDTNGSSSTYSGAVEGAGALTKVGANTLFLAGSNSYSGGTNINAGTINFNNNSALGSGAITFNGGTLQAGAENLSIGLPMTLNASSGTIDAAGNSLTLSGVIGGSGGLTIMSTVASTGTVILSNANTYSGGTSINSGVLQIANDANLGVSAGTVTFNGGTLQAGTSFFSARNMVIGSSSGTIDTNSFLIVLTGAISGGSSANGLTVTDNSGIGTGLLYLTGASTYSGGTTVKSGTLELGANGALPGGGDITVNSGATFNMQGFTQTVGNYNPTGGGGTVSMILRPGVTNLTVNGVGNFTHDTLVASFTPQIIPFVTPGFPFTPIAVAGSGSFSGPSTKTFANIIPPAAFSFTQNVVGNNLVLTTNFVPFATSAVNSNQAAVANSIEPLRNSPTGDVATVIGNLYTMNASQLQSALDQIGPISLASMQAIGLQGSSVESAAVSQRMAVLADGSSHGGLSSYTVNARSPVPGDLIASAGENDTGYWNQSSGSNSPWGFFTSGVATAGRLQEANSSSGLQPGYAFNTGGLTGGADYSFTDHLAAGASFGYLHGHASIYAPASGTVNNNSARYGAYATLFDENSRVNMYVGGAADFFTTNRGILFSGVSRTATASPRGSEINLHPDASYDIKSVNWGTFSPFVGLNYDRLAVGGFTETGADSLDLSVAPQTAESLESSLGIKYSQKLTGDWYSWTPYGSLGWRHEFENQSRPIDAQLAAGGATQFSVNTGNYARDGTLVGLGFAFILNEQTTAKFDYTGDFRSHYQDSLFNASVRWKF